MPAPSHSTTTNIHQSLRSFPTRKPTFAFPTTRKLRQQESKQKLHLFICTAIRQYPRMLRKFVCSKEIAIRRTRLRASVVSSAFVFFASSCLRV
jgi:hypothetical protein